jgi:hypothetical protein
MLPQTVLAVFLAFNTLGLIAILFFAFAHTEPGTLNSETDITRVKELHEL